MTLNAEKTNRSKLILRKVDLVIEFQIKNDFNTCTVSKFNERREELQSCIHLN